MSYTYLDAGVQVLKLARKLSDYQPGKNMWDQLRAVMPFITKLRRELLFTAHHEA